MNDVFTGVIDSTYAYPQNVSVILAPGTKVQLLVENLGRVDYYSRGTTETNMVIDPAKGILGDVRVGNATLGGWTSQGLPLDNVPVLETQYSSANTALPRFYKGTFSVADVHGDAAARDTYLAIPNGVKGNVWVNGFHLGRYWGVGPQTALYLPGTVVKERNEVVVLELEPGWIKGEMRAEGLREREWVVREDVDCVGCVR